MKRRVTQIEEFGARKRPPRVGRELDGVDRRGDRVGQQLERSSARVDVARAASSPSRAAPAFGVARLPILFF